MDDLTVKLTDHALSRDLFPEDYDCLPTDLSNESLPLKFMAIESINDRRFSTASDVVRSIVLSLSTVFQFSSLSISGHMVFFSGK